MKTMKMMMKPVQKRVMAVAALFCAAVAQGAGYTWTGGADPDTGWTTPQNWGQSVNYPGINGNAGADTATFTSDAFVSITGPLRVNTLSLNNAPRTYVLDIAPGASLTAGMTVPSGNQKKDVTLQGGGTVTNTTTLQVFNQAGGKDSLFTVDGTALVVNGALEVAATGSYQTENNRFVARNGATVLVTGNLTVSGMQALAYTADARNRIDVEDGAQLTVTGGLFALRKAARLGIIRSGSIVTKNLRINNTADHQMPYATGLDFVVGPSFLTPNIAPLLVDGTLELIENGVNVPLLMTVAVTPQAVSSGVTNDVPLFAYRTASLSDANSIIASMVQNAVMTPTNMTLSTRSVTTNGFNYTVVYMDNVEAELVAVTFDADGGTFTGGTGTKAVDFIGGVAYGTFPEPPAYSGFSFGGWWTAQSGGDLVLPSSLAPSAIPALTLYARWNPCPSTAWTGADVTDPTAFFAIGNWDTAIPAYGMKTTINVNNARVEIGGADPDGYMGPLEIGLVANRMTTLSVAPGKALLVGGNLRVGPEETGTYVTSIRTAFEGGGIYSVEGDFNAPCTNGHNGYVTSVLGQDTTLHVHGNVNVGFGGNNNTYNNRLVLDGGAKLDFQGMLNVSTPDCNSTPNALIVGDGQVTGTAPGGHIMLRQRSQLVISNANAQVEAAGLTMITSGSPHTSQLQFHVPAAGYQTTLPAPLTIHGLLDVDANARLLVNLEDYAGSAPVPLFAYKSVNNPSLLTAMVAVNAEISLGFQLTSVTQGGYTVYSAEPILNGITVTFDPQNGGPTFTQDWPSDALVYGGTLPGGLTRPDYTFAGWNTLADGTGQQVSAGTAFDPNITILYAQWQVASATWTGAVSSDFFLNGNWTPGFPIPTAAAIINVTPPAVVTNNVTVATLTMGKVAGENPVLTVEPGKTLTVTGNSVFLDSQSDVTVTLTGGGTVQGTTADMFVGAYTNRQFILSDATYTLNNIRPMSLSNASYRDNWFIVRDGGVLNYNQTFEFGAQQNTPINLPNVIDVCNGMILGGVNGNMLLSRNAMLRISGEDSAVRVNNLSARIVEMQPVVKFVIPPRFFSAGDKLAPLTINGTFASGMALNVDATACTKGGLVPLIAVKTNDVGFLTSPSFWTNIVLTARWPLTLETETVTKDSDTYSILSVRVQCNTPTLILVR